MRGGLNPIGYERMNPNLHRAALVSDPCVVDSTLSYVCSDDKPPSFPPIECAAGCELRPSGTSERSPNLQRFGDLYPFGGRRLHL